MHLADFTAPIGPDTYVEVLAPTTPDHSVARWLGRVGGASGWVLSTQVPSLDGVKERAAERGVRIAVQTQAMGHDIVQLHPLDVGVLLELDAFLPRVGWFWDDMPAAKAAHALRSTKADNIVAVDVAVDAAAGGPAAMAATWAAIIGLDPPDANRDGAAIAFSSRTIPVRARPFRPDRDRRRRRARDRPGPRGGPDRRAVPHADPFRLTAGPGLFRAERGRP
jgi:hypothetical protein